MLKHVERACIKLRKLKDILPEHDITIQMDFAENFTCRCLYEVQTVYWNQTSVTLNHESSSIFFLWTVNVSFIMM